MYSILACVLLWYIDLLPVPGMARFLWLLMSLEPSGFAPAPMLVFRDGDFHSLSK